MPLRHLLSFVLVLGMMVPTINAQQTAFTVRADQAGGTTLELDVRWSLSLQAALDSVQATILDDRTLRALTHGTLLASETIELSNAVQPAARIVGMAYDEVAIEAPAIAQPLLQSIQEEFVQVEGLGFARRQPVVTVSVPLYHYDAARGVLKRYRSITVAVEEGRGTPVFPAKAGQTNPHLLVTESALATGQLFRLPIAQEGIYRIDRSLLSALGLAPDSIDPNNVQILGNGGAPLPALAGAPRYADLVENAVFVRGGGDGRFDDGDVVLFYGAGPSGWRSQQVVDRFGNATGAWEWAHYVNPFAVENRYFLKVGSTQGARVQAASYPNLTGTTTLTSVTGRAFRDFDDFNWSREHGSGHTWVSRPIRVGGEAEVFQNESLPGLEAGTVSYKARVAIQSNPRATVDFVSGATVLQSTLAPGITFDDSDDPVALATDAVFTQDVSAATGLNLAMRLQPSIREPQAAIDWVRVFYPKALRADGGLLRFATPLRTAGRFTYVLSGFASEPQVWDVTSPDAIRRLGVQSSGGTYRVQVEVTDLNQPRELIAFVESAAATVASDNAVAVANQNLHGIQRFPQFVIITPEAFRASADELAAMREQEGLPTVVVTNEQIFNEFSGGVPDMRATRDYLKFIYDRATDDGNLLRYALFFGDGHFNFRNLGSDPINVGNQLFPFATEISFDPTASYTSDDYFGLLDDNEGVWEFEGIRTVSDERMDIGVGRLPAQTPEEAAMLVDKIRRYESPETYGPWRSTYTLVADDGPTGRTAQQNDADLHMQNVDQVADLLEGGVYPQIDLQKIYAESFNRVFRNGFRIPEAKAAISDAINEGTLVVNYSGHGGPDGLAQEEIFTTEDAQALQNRDKLAIFVTATCSFGWWDLQEGQSGAEELLLNPNGGAVALMTTVRLVYTSGDTTALNAGLNRALNINLFRRDAEGKPRRLGDVMQLTKNTRVGLQGNSRKFNLLGDPSMRVGLPQTTAVVETINGATLSETPLQMRALDRVTITGSIRDGEGGVLTSFNGPTTVTVYDAERQIDVLIRRWMPQPYYTIREDLIWRGEVEAVQGRFEATFVVPKDISYSNEGGRVTVYAADASQHALGYTESFIVGGTSDNPPDDSEGPRISLFLNDTTFVSGGMVPPSPELIVQLFDESGINTVGAGVGHEMLLVVDGDEANAIDIGSAFRSVENSFQRGEVRWRLDELAPGSGTLNVRAWDVLNNSGAAALDFFVSQQEDLALRNVFNYPNPTTGPTRFIFEHNQPSGTPAEVQVRVYTLNGQLVRSIESDEALPTGILTSGPVQVVWDGRDEDFDRLGSGVYLYKIRVRTEDADGNRQVVEQIDKVAVIR